MGVEPDVLASAQRGDQVTALRQMQDIASKQGMDNMAIAANQQAGMDASRQFQAQN
jgi:hypothetical protein